jgi:hypothetical protein
MTITATLPRPDRAEINRRNARKSTGPRTPEGKARSRFNAVKHGMTAKTLVLPGEDPELLAARLESWTADLGPQNAVERFLVEQAVHSSWKLDRADRAEAARLAQLIESVPRAEADRQSDVVAALGYWLLSDRDVMGDIRLRSDLLNVLAPGQKCASPDCRTIDILDHPEAIVRRLEETAAGCQWLLDRWADLRADLEQGSPWGFAEKARALRLLGRRPLELGPAKWADYLEDRENDRATAPDRLVDQRLDAQLDPRLTAKRSETLTVLRSIAEAAIARLEALLAEHRRRGEEESARQAAMLSFDASNEGERLRRYQFACSRSLFRGLDTLLKIRRSGMAAGEEESSTAEDAEAMEANPEPGGDGERFTPETAELVETSQEPCPGAPVACPVQPAVDGEDSGIELTAAPVDVENPQNELTTPQLADLDRRRLPFIRTLLSAFILISLFGAAIRGPGSRQIEPRIVPDGLVQFREGEPPSQPDRDGARSEPRGSGITDGASVDRKDRRNKARCQDGSPPIPENPIRAGDPGSGRGSEGPTDEPTRRRLGERRVRINGP